jgi:uncharacterized protein YutE (UPF0331/DUF86 family)
MFVVLDKIAIEQKLTSLAAYLDELEQISQYSYQEYKANFQIKRTVERLIQLVVECATDINGLLITGLGEVPPRDYFSSFIALGDFSILPADFADTLAPTTAIRNRLVHEYETVDERLVYVSVKPILEEFTQYAGLVNKYLKGTEHRA